MQTHERESQAPGLALGDIYYILFRRKWTIIFLSAAGLLAAGMLYFFKPPIYSSEAKLFIRYVMESRLPGGLAGDPQIRTPDPGGANIINSEIEIFKSLDLALQVVDAVGPEKILGKGGGDTNRYKAAVALQKGLLVEVPARTDILRIVFQSPNREIVSPVLTQFIDAYLRRHVEIHRSIGAFDDVLTQQTDALRAQLAQTEADLRKAQTNAGLVSVDDAKKAFAEEISKIRENLFNTQAELAERQAAFQERQKLMPAPTAAVTNAPDVAVPATKIDEYKSVSARLEAFRRREQDLLTQFTAENSLVQGMRDQIAATEKLQRALEAQYPNLTRLQPPSSPSQPGSPSRDLSEEAAQITALQAKIKVLSAQLDKLTADAKTVNELEPTITELQRKKDLEETKYRHFSTSLEQARFDEALGAGKMSNISVAQSPSPPTRESRKLVKTLGMIVTGGIAAGLALAFALELFIDPTVRRPIDVEGRLRLPLFLTIPRFGKNGFAALPAPSVSAAGPGAGAEAQESNGQASTGALVPRLANGLDSYYDALRDRLIASFESRNLTHKPKLIAVTGCAPEAGVTTIAAGLAASLSETGDGNVLLVDMTAEQGAAHQFRKGKPNLGLADALAVEKRDDAMVQDNLYVVSESSNASQLPRVLPRRFNNLVPKLKASDYDYIIFDMPPVNQISITPRISGFMDMVLLVIESEKTDREVVKRAAAMLADSKASVSAILNKVHRYVPKALQQEL